MLTLPRGDFAGTRTGCFWSSSTPPAAGFPRRRNSSFRRDPGERAAEGAREGDKERFVYLGHPARAALADYLPLRSALLERLGRPDEEALFLNKRGSALTTRGMRGIIDFYARAAGINKRVSPHSFGTVSPPI